MVGGAESEKSLVQWFGVVWEGCFLVCSYRKSNLDLRTYPIFQNGKCLATWGCIEFPNSNLMPIWGVFCHHHWLFYIPKMDDGN